MIVFFFEQKTAYEMRSSDWSADVCSSDLSASGFAAAYPEGEGAEQRTADRLRSALHADGRSCRRIRPLPLRYRRGPGLGPSPPDLRERQIGRASCRERVCKYV